LVSGDEVKFKGHVTSVRSGLEVRQGDESISIMAVVEVGFYYEGSVTFTCPVDEAPRMGDTFIVEITRLELPPQSPS
jgi:hypothetical protein